MTTQDHWTDDADLLAQYVLRQLPTPRYEELAHHLASCAVCRERVEREIVLAAGIRRAARAQMKERLNTRLGPAPAARTSNWGYLLRAVAVLIVMVGVVVIVKKTGVEGEKMRDGESVGAWEKKSEGGKEGMSESGKEKKSEGGKEKESVRAWDTREGENAKREERQLADAKGAIEARPEGHAAKPAVIPERTLADAATHPSEHATMPGAGAGGAAGVEAKSEALSGADIASAQTEWIEGDIQTTPAKGRPSTALYSGNAPATDALKKDVAAEQPVAAPSAADAAQDAKIAGNVSARNAAAKQSAGPALQSNAVTNARTDAGFSQQQVRRRVILLSQRLASDLPPAQQQAQMRRRVLAQMQASGDTLHMTIYLDRLLSANEWRRTTAVQVGDDSVVVVMPGEMVSYRLAGAAQQR